MSRSPRACSYPTVTIWLHQWATPHFLLSSSAISLWGIDLAPALSSTLSHSSQLFPVARCTASLPTPARRRFLGLAPRAGARIALGLATALRSAGLRVGDISGRGAGGTPAARKDVRPARS